MEFKAGQKVVLLQVQDCVIVRAQSGLKLKKEKDGDFTVLGTKLVFDKFGNELDGDMESDNYMYLVPEKFILKTK